MGHLVRKERRPGPELVDTSDRHRLVVVRRPIPSGHEAPRNTWDPSYRRFRGRGCRWRWGQEPLKVGSFVEIQEAGDLGAEVVIAGACGMEPLVTFAGFEPSRGIKQVADLLPAL